MSLLGATQEKGKRFEGKCLNNDFACKNKSYNKFSENKNFLVCRKHKDTKKNKELLQKYKERCILM